MRHRTLPALLTAQAARFGERMLFRSGASAWSYAQAPLVAATSAGRLAALGLRRGDRVGILAANSAELMAVLLGCLWSGVIAVPINTQAKAPQIRHIVGLAGIRVLIADAGLRAEVDADVVVHDIAAPSDFAPQDAADLAPGDTAAILFTSGTTGLPKGVCCPQAQLVWWGANTADLLAITADDTLCTALPLFHVNALNSFYQALLHGSALVLLPRFSVSRFWTAMAAERATVTYLLGAMVPILLSRPPGPEERDHLLRAALAPGVPAHLHTALFERTGLRPLDGYGSTETNFVIGAKLDRQRPGLLGPAAPGFTARVADENDAEVPPGTPGELLLRHDEPFAFATGYWGQPDQTVAAWRNLWFHTGDRVVRDEDGWFRFVDRIKDSIRRRGENISAHEVEQVLLSHPAVAAAAVFPVRSELAEDEVMAAIVLQPGPAPDCADIASFAAALLPRFAVPRFIAVCDALPLTANGKVAKQALIEAGVGPGVWDAQAGQPRVATLAPGRGD
jgi:crotonobetaine/carnitine-CoA ligase